MVRGSLQLSPDFSGLSVAWICLLFDPLLQPPSKPQDPHSLTPASPGGNILKNSYTFIFSTQAASSHREMLGASPEVPEARPHQSAHEERWLG